MRSLSEEIALNSNAGKKLDLGSISDLEQVMLNWIYDVLLLNKDFVLNAYPKPNTNIEIHKQHIHDILDKVVELLTPSDGKVSFKTRSFSLENKRLSNDLLEANNNIERLRIKIDTILNSPIDDIRIKYSELEEQNHALAKIANEYIDIRKKFPFLVGETFYYLSGNKIKKEVVVKMGEIGVYDGKGSYFNNSDIYKTPDALKDALVIIE